MGLFIGASILTILELFDYAYEVRRLESVCLPTRIPVERINKPTHHSVAASDTFYRSKKQKSIFCLPVRAALTDNKRKKKKTKKHQ